MLEKIKRYFIYYWNYFYGYRTNERGEEILRYLLKVYKADYMPRTEKERVNEEFLVGCMSKNGGISRKEVARATCLVLMSGLHPKKSNRIEQEVDYWISTHPSLAAEQTKTSTD